MPKQGQTLTNPIQGDSYDFLETAQSTHGERVVMKACIHTQGQLVPNHLHVFQDEHFEVLSGELVIIHRGQKSLLKAGESMLLPKNEAHNHYNGSGEPVTYIHTVSPALDFEFLIENLVGLASDGKGKNGQFGLLQELVTLKYLDSKSYLADVPVFIQQILMQVVAPFARLFGYRAVYKKYSGFEK